VISCTASVATTAKQTKFHLLNDNHFKPFSALTLLAGRQERHSFGLQKKSAAEIPKSSLSLYDFEGSGISCSNVGPTNDVHIDRMRWNTETACLADY